MPRLLSSDLLFDGYQKSKYQRESNKERGKERKKEHKIDSFEVNTCPVVASSPMIERSNASMAEASFLHRTTATRKPVGSTDTSKNHISSKTIMLPKDFSQTVELHPVVETWHHFLESYGRCDTNLSNIPRPICFDGDGFMSPPLARNDNTRSQLAEACFQWPQWQNVEFFENLIRPVLHRFRLTGASVSLINRTKQVVMVDIGLSMFSISRNVSLDGHALLSSEPLIIPDTANDWRTAHNPLVRGPPYIRFYAGAPLLSKKSKGLPIGVFSVFAPFARGANPDNPSAGLIEINEMKELQRIMKQVSVAIMTYLDQDIADMSKEGLPAIIGPIGPVNPVDLNIRLGTDGQTVINNTMSHRALNHNYNGRNGDTPLMCLPQFPMALPEDFLSSESFKWLECHPAQLKSHEITQELVGYKNSKKVCDRVCQLLVDNLELDIAYVVEARVLSTHDEIDSTNLEKVFSKGNRKVLMRLFASFGLDEDSTYAFDEDVHATVLLSNLGVQYRLDSPYLAYKSGIFMSFGRTDIEAAKLTSDKGSSKLNKYGGYVIAGLSKYSRPFVPAQIEYMKICTASLDGMFIYD